MALDQEHREQFRRGVELFNRGQFYECHDTIEEIWLQEASNEQGFLQGIIQAAVGFHHYQQGKAGAARRMLELALQKLEPYPPLYAGIDLESFRRALHSWKGVLDQGVARGLKRVNLPFPRIREKEE